MGSWGEVLIAVVSAISGGGLLKYLEMWLGRTKQKTDLNKEFRDEYRSDIQSLRDDVKSMKTELAAEKKSRETAEHNADWWRDYAQDVVIKFRFFQLDIKEVLKNNGIDIPEDKFIVIDFPHDR